MAAEGDGAAGEGSKLEVARAVCQPASSSHQQEESAALRADARRQITTEGLGLLEVGPREAADDWHIACLVNVASHVHGYASHGVKVVG